MSKEQVIWGVHMPIEFGSEPVDKGFVAIGWPQLGDLSRLPPDREGFKKAYQQAFPGLKPRAVQVSGGQVYRFAHEMETGDLIVYPSKHDRMINIGKIAGRYRYDPSSSEYPNRHDVDWMTSVSRDEFSQSARYEFGSFLAVFRIASHVDDVLAALAGKLPAPAADEDDSSDAATIAEHFEESTEDFVIGRLKNAQNAYEFEHFIAHLLQCMGYYARVTKASGDGGVDVIAHRDELGFEEPIIKVQCKQTLGGSGRPDVQKLFGAIEREEKGLFVTLGTFSPDARTFEQSKSNLRLIDGRTLVELIFAHYDKFSPRYQALVPLKRTYSAGI